MKMRRAFIGLITLLLVFPVLAEAQSSGTGNIYGRTIDAERNPLPGVSVTIDGAYIAPISMATNPEGIFRFPNLPPARDYTITAELPGFKKTIRTDIAVFLGSNIEVNITMEFGVLEEEVIVTAETSAVVDMKRTSISQRVSETMLQDLPSGRSVFTILHMAPGVITGSEDVGGSHAGSQHTPTARGGTTSFDNVFAMDGVAFQDGSARGSAAIYPDIDFFDEMVVTTGGSDVTVQTGGVAIEMITRRAGARVSMGARFYLTDESFQGDNMTDALRQEGIPGTIGIHHIKEYGFNVGLPLVRNKAWFWGMYGVMDADKTTIFGRPEVAMHTNIAAKINLQLVPNNRFEFLWLGSGREVFGRSPSHSFPAGWYQSQRYRFGTPTIKIQDEHYFGDNLIVSAKFNALRGGFRLQPEINREWDKIAFYNVTTRVWEGSHDQYYVERPQNRLNLGMQYYNDKLFGVSHEMKMGIEYANREQLNWGAWPMPGNLEIFRNFNYPTVDFTGDGRPDIYPGIQRIEIRSEPGRGIARVDSFSLYFSDSITYGRTNTLLGLRFDRQTPIRAAYDYPVVMRDHPVWINHFTSMATDAIDNIIPGVTMPEVKATAADGSPYRWDVFSPRFAFSWDIMGDRKTILKISASSYGEFMGTGEANYWTRGGVDRWMRFWWLDHNSNGIVDLNELYWHNLNVQPTYGLYKVFDDAGNFLGNFQDAAGIMYGKYDPMNPSATTDPYTLIDPKTGSERTRELILAIDRELTLDFGLSVNATFRRYDNRKWDLMNFPETGQIQNQDWYVSAGTPPSTIPGLGDTGNARNHEWYVLKPEYGYTPWRYRTYRPDYRVDFWGVDFIFDKRLSNKWMMNGSFSLLHQAVYYGDKGSLDRNNLWALDGRPEQTLNPRWMFKVGGLYQLPFDIDFSLNFLAREGRFVSETFSITDYNLPNPRSNSATLYINERGSQRLDAVYNLSLRLQKRVRMGDTGAIHFMVDVFNALNSNTILARNDITNGAYFVQSGIFAPHATSYRASSILNPRVLKLGVRFQF